MEKISTMPNNQAQYVQPTQLAGSFPVSAPMASSVQNGGNITQYSGLIGAGLGFVSGILDRRAARKEAAAQRDWNEAMLDKQNEWSLNQWNMTNEYNTPLHQKERLLEAGMNPLYYGLDGTSANAFQSAQPLGYDRAKIENMTNPLAAGLAGYMSMRGQEKQIELQNAQIDKIKAETENVGLDTEFKDKTMAARVEAEKLANSLTKETISKIQEEKKQVIANTKKLIEETKTEVERQALIAAETAVQKATEKQIVEMLPYQKLLVQAETQAQKAAAAASFAHAMYERRLLESGYIDKMNEKMDEEIKKLGTENEREKALAARDKFITAIKTGELLHSDNKAVQVFYDYICNYPLKFLTTVGTVFDDFSSLILAGGIGKAAAGFKKASGKVPTIYGADGQTISSVSYDF